MKKKKIALLDLGGVVFEMYGEKMYGESNKEINWETIWILNEKYGTKTGGLDFPNFLIEYNNLSNQNLEGKEF